MTTKGAYELLRMNRLFYQSQVKPMSDEDTAQIARVWEYQFRDWPDNAVKDAYLAAQKECVFPVSVADIFRHLPSESPSWEKAMKAAREINRWLYYAKTGGLVGPGGKKDPTACTEEAVKVWDTLPESVRSWAGTMGLLARNADADPDELAQFVRPTFEKATKKEKLPPEPMRIAATEERKALMTGYKPLRLKKGE